jgi:hypothetical protein
VDADSPEVARLAAGTPGSVVIPVTIDPLESLRMIAGCEFIASSSLHGLIAADALGIPNWRLSFSAGITGGDYKFRDYAMGVGRADIRTAVMPEDGNLTALESERCDWSFMASLESRGEALGRALVQSLPE